MSTLPAQERETWQRIFAEQNRVADRLYPWRRARLTQAGQQWKDER